MVPVPVPREVLDALESVEVHAAAGDTQSGFELTFRLSRRSPLHTLFLLTGGLTPYPILRVIIVADLDGTSEVLMDGVMTKHEVHDSGSGEPSLVVTGKDLSAVMDWIPLDGMPYPAQPYAIRALAMLAKYAAFGVVPLVIPAIIENIPLPIEEIPRQQGTDFAYLTAMAKEAGYVFYVEPGGVPGVSKAYWGPEIRVGVPQPALGLELDLPHRNVETLSFSYEPERVELPIVWIQEQLSKVPVFIPVPNVNPLNPQLGAIPTLPTKQVLIDHTAGLKPWVAALHGLAYASQHWDSVSGNGTLDVVRYGRVLRSRQLVGVRGAGEAFDGLYYVQRVTHTIKRGEFKQSFTLARHGLLSMIPRVPV